MKLQPFPGTLDPIDAECRSSLELSPYDAVGALWVCLFKYAMMLPTAGEEHEQVCSLVRHLDHGTVRSILSDTSVQVLLAMDPPIEQVLSHPRERLASIRAGREIDRLRRFQTDPQKALLAIVEILQRIRDKRMHGFKTPQGPRDQPILESASTLLRLLCEASTSQLRALAREQAHRQV